MFLYRGCQDHPGPTLNESFRVTVAPRLSRHTAQAVCLDKTRRPSQRNLDLRAVRSGTARVPLLLQHQPTFNNTHSLTSLAFHNPRRGGGVWRAGGPRRSRRGRGVSRRGWGRWGGERGGVSHKNPVLLKTKRGAVSQ